MPRAALLLRHRPMMQVMRQPLNGDPAPFRDPRGPGQHGTLPRREALELLRCIQIMGPQSGPQCRHDILGEPLPEFETDAGISSPVPFGAGTGSAGERTAHLGGIGVTLLPDTTSSDPAMQGRAETSINFNSYSINWASNGRGIVTSITGPEAPLATIQTTYGPDVSATSASGYGRGTTPGDIATGNTSLGFHEGQHGVDFLRFMRANPFPIFTGTVGMTVAQVRLAIQTYRTERDAYIKRLNRISVENTDCVGAAIGRSNAVQVICNAAAARAAAGRRRRRTP